MKQLQLGIMTNIELADWFGVKPNTLTHAKAKKLKELENYCKFDIVKNKVNILEIYEDTYINIKSKPFKTILEHIDEEWAENGLDTGKDVSQRLKKRFPKVLNITDATAAKYTCKARNLKYGKPFSQTGGELGKCEYIWCKRLSDGTLAFLTEEEEEIKKTYLTKHFGSAKEKTALVQALVLDKKISKEEAWSYYSDIMHLSGAFMGFIADMHEQGINIVKGTLVTRNGIVYLEECADTN